METASSWSMSSLNLKKAQESIHELKVFADIDVACFANCSPVHKTCHEGSYESYVSLSHSTSNFWSSRPVLPHPSPGHAWQPPSGTLDNLVTSNVSQRENWGEPMAGEPSLSFTPQMQQWANGTWCFLSMALHRNSHSSEFSHFGLPQNIIKGTKSLAATLHFVSHVFWC